ncbi:HET-domain-containing protein [Hyaloscypha hepaticicola]|uniref:HET-domain-containing protein n=1 Tax=Hyaloscypha hepaticicola TaxID=2082293 RepID=A0A2J6PX02_9HELO|nr:HET-domain-containing protein [Hyaloscypha hepaticicola]
MWLLDTTTLALSAFFDANTPSYAILSHTWGSEEVSFQDIQGPHEQISHRAGYNKIKDCCAKALEAGFQYVWIDTCCIDKTNSTELSEAINSMFRWYQNAVTCYAYLEDIRAPAWRFWQSRWFKRGWTLQELIAPINVLFWDCEWNEIGSRASLGTEIESITGIPARILLRNSSLRDHCVAEIMSWAADRQTTRIEDRAYSLLGLFGVSMPLIYGEGANAFLRLQLEIMKATTDHSLFAWNDRSGDHKTRSHLVVHHSACFSQPSSSNDPRKTISMSRL